MMLTFAEYQKLGGKCDEETFSRFEPISESYLNNYTLGRLRNVSSVPEEVKLVLTLFVDTLSEGARVPSNLTSYSNGIEQLSYESSSAKATEYTLYHIAITHLPVELISCYIEDDV